MGSAAVNNVLRLGGDMSVDNPAAILPKSLHSSITMLSMFNGGTTANNYMALNGWRATSNNQYQVPNGKALRGLGFWGKSNSANTVFILGYADTALATPDTASAPTTPIYFSNSATSGSVYLDGTTYKWYSFQFEIPAQKYPFLRAVTNAVALAVNLVGVEETA